MFNGMDIIITILIWNCFQESNRNFSHTNHFFCLSMDMLLQYIITFLNIYIPTIFCAVICVQSSSLNSMDRKCISYIVWIMGLCLFNFRVYCVAVLSLRVELEMYLAVLWEKRSLWLVETGRVIRYSKWMKKFFF